MRSEQSGPTAYRYNELKLIEITGKCQSAGCGRNSVLSAV